ncbi:hypothetical protein FRB94_003001 [Tulasnella sp. JGI-2019a]|nr:hypothetical protein FRB93_010955 [Tulasnella sp. JGI-2019a]KAG8986245.1 hypothetical protein FRB94_003001 [Tulasnella sp. JGI-2019a]
MGMDLDSDADLDDEEDMCPHPGLPTIDKYPRDDNEGATNSFANHANNNTNRSSDRYCHMEEDEEEDKLEDDNNKKSERYVHMVQA